MKFLAGLLMIDLDVGAVTVHWVLICIFLIFEIFVSVRRHGRKGLDKEVGLEKLR